MFFLRPRFSEILDFIVILVVEFCCRRYTKFFVISLYFFCNMLKISLKALFSNSLVSYL